MFDRMLALRRAALFITLFGLSGCAPDSFSSTDGGDDATSPTDSGVDAIIDAAPPFESGGGEGGSGDGGVVVSCLGVLSGTILCDDFDSEDGGSVAQKWTGQLNYNGSNSFDSVVFHSSPRSYRAATSGSDGGTGSFANSGLLIQSTQTLPAGTTLTTSAFVRLHNISSAAATPILQVSYTPSSGTSVYAAIVVDNNKLTLQVQADGSSVTSNDNLANVVIDTWVFVQLDMSIKPDRVSASLDGLPIKTVTPTLAMPSSTPLPQVELGILIGSTSFAAIANFDNFLFRIH
jgi:hypothetical protein